LHIKPGINKQVILFTIIRYVTFSIQFIKGILVAKLLGPYYFGIWGFIVLIQQYLSYTNLGVQYAINLELAISDMEDQKAHSLLINSSLFISTIIFILLLFTGIILRALSISLFPAYHTSEYILFILIVVGLTNFREIFSNIYRVYNRLIRISIAEILFALIPFSVIFFFREKYLIYALLISMIIALVLGNFLFVHRTPFELALEISIRNLKTLLKISIPLLIYNASFYLIMISSRTIVSFFYSVAMMGMYSLAYSITNATFLGLNALSWVFFPVILSRVKLGIDDSSVTNTIEKVTKLYGTLVFCVVIIAILFSPIIFLYLDHYKPIECVLNIFFITQGVLTLNLAHISVALARKKQMRIVLYSLGSLLLMIITGIGIGINQLHIKWLAFATFVATLLFVFSTTLFVSRKIILCSDILRKTFSLRVLIPIALIIISNLFWDSYYIAILGAILFFILNKENIVYLIKYLKYNLKTIRS